MQSYRNEFPLRLPEVVMDIRRLGSMHQSRMSFMRELVRKIMREQWQIKHSIFELDDQGFGTAVYSIDTPTQRYSYVLFSNFLEDHERNDRVIAEKWDVTMALCIGDVSVQQLQDLRINVPKQELGRYASNVIVLSRGNKSSRNFDYVVEQLSQGLQPDVAHFIDAGYLYRTTAVYGSGKFGMADWYKVKSHCLEFNKPFSAEMFNCFMLRHFSLEQTAHLAKAIGNGKSVSMDTKIKHYVGIGNSTGLGMAPYLIRHPKLISQWVLSRERAIASVSNLGEVNPASISALAALLSKAQLHIQQTVVPDPIQSRKNQVLAVELASTATWLGASVQIGTNWRALVGHVFQSYSIETQELLNSLLLELHPDLCDEVYAHVDESFDTSPEMSVAELRSIIESHYQWALDYDFSQYCASHFFWYRSEEKMEPRIGQRFNEPGVEKEMPLVIARLVRQCYDKLSDFDDSQSVAELILTTPNLSAIVNRIQTMSHQCYGEIRGNLADIDMRPMDLLRCKLSFFGVSKFDPKSKLWVRNTMFQGAPLVSDIGKPFKDDWCFPIAPTELSLRH